MPNKQTPPEFKARKKKSNVGAFIAGALATILLSGAVGYGCARFAINQSISSSNGSGVTIVQQTGNSSHNSVVVEDVSDIAAKCGPSVVEIIVEKTQNDQWFGQYTAAGAGSGVIISEDGYIVTNNHVIADATSIVVRTTDGTEYAANLVGTDVDSDIAVIKIDAKNLTSATFGDSDSLEVGDAAIVIGNPLVMLGGTVTSGIISSLDRQLTIDGVTMTLLQTDAAINPGNSGGGLFDANGNLIGIVNAKTSQEGIEGLGFAIPINSAMDIINELMTNGEVTTRPALNVSLYDHNASSYYMSSKEEEGVYIVQIVPGGAADEAGLQTNDRIISVDGTKVMTASEVKAVLYKHKVGDTIEIVVVRDGEEKSFQVTLHSQSQ
jgi:serine protease Do